jgi:uncharacterized membrane protein YgaE (UPF0421/DUF939 family)
MTPVAKEPAAPWHRSLRLVLCIALASGLTWSICRSFGLGGATPYGVVIAALMVRPRFDRWPAPVFLLLPLVVAVGLGLGTGLRPLLQAPQVWQFAVVTACAQVLGQALPDRLLMVRNLLAILAVLPLLSADATWLVAWQQLLAVTIGMAVAAGLQAALRLPGEGVDSAPEPELELPPRGLGQRFADPFFWRKLVVSMLALSIGLGVGAVTPKYLYFGVVLLLNDSLGATLGRVRDRMVGVSLGVLMPWLVFNTLGVDPVTVAIVMGGTTALLLSLGLLPHLRTALISSGVTFVGYGVLTDWYVPSRWLDYLMGSALALLVCLLVRPVSALRRFRALARSQQELPGPMGLSPDLAALLPSALEEARLLGQEQDFLRLLQQLQPEDGRVGGGRAVGPCHDR